MKISKDVFIIMQYFIEQYTVNFLEKVNTAAIHAGRVKVMPTDICYARQTGISTGNGNIGKECIWEVQSPDDCSTPSSMPSIEISCYECLDICYTTNQPETVTVTVVVTTQCPNYQENACSIRGKPTRLTFYISGGPPVESFQEGKGMSSGDIILFNSYYTVNCDNSLLSRTNNYIFELSEFEDNDITCDIYDSAGRHQVISFYVSCSKRLVVDDSFGAINLNDYVNSGGYSPCSMQYHNGENWNVWNVSYYLLFILY